MIIEGLSKIIYECLREQAAAWKCWLWCWCKLHWADALSVPRKSTLSPQTFGLKSVGVFKNI